MRYELAVHYPSGECYALICDAGGNITDLCGPLHRTEYIPATESPSSLYDFNYTTEDIEWANTQQWHTVCTYTPAVRVGVSQRPS